jgi:hypothetical protein
VQKIFRLDTWKVFLLILLPLVIPDTEFGFGLQVAYLIFSLCWYYYLALELYKLLPEDHEMYFSKFKFHFFFPLFYFTIAFIFTGGGYSLTLNGMNEYGPTGELMIPLHLFGMYCIFYCLYFIAKVMTMAKYQKCDVEIKEYIGYFFALWFIPIGIWVIQPILQELFMEDEIQQP